MLNSNNNWSGWMMKVILILTILSYFSIINNKLNAEEPVSYMDSDEGLVYECYFNYLYKRPRGADKSYAEEVQGITHDNKNWYISQKWNLWKIPAIFDLAESIECNKERDGEKIICAKSDSLSSINQSFSSYNGFNHIGGIDYYQYNEHTGFLFLPIDGCIYEGMVCEQKIGGIAVFNPSDLSYIDHTILQEFNNAPWVAIDSDGFLYTSTKTKKDFGYIFKFSIDWGRLMNNEDKKLLLTCEEKFYLKDEFNDIIKIDPQGGVFSESGNLLYLSSVKYNITVFDMKTRRLIKRSHNTCRCECCACLESTCQNKYHYWDIGGPFWYNNLPYPGEPEGLTIWDIDKVNPHHPSIKGKLHVLLLGNQWPSDKVTIYHYDNSIFVDKENTSEHPLGTPDNPFNTVNDAHELAWPGSQIKIKKGYYQELITFSKPIKVDALEGHVIIEAP